MVKREALTAQTTSENDEDTTVTAVQDESEMEQENDHVCKMHL